MRDAFRCRSRGNTDKLSFRFGSFTSSLLVPSKEACIVQDLLGTQAILSVLLSIQVQCQGRQACKASAAEMFQALCAHALAQCDTVLPVASFHITDREAGAMDDFCSFGS